MPSLLTRPFGHCAFCTRCSLPKSSKSSASLGVESARRMGLLRGAIDSISAKLAFFPPTPSTYEVKAHDDRPDELYILPLHRDVRKVLNCEVVRLPTKPRQGAGGNTTIIVAYVPYKRVVPVLLFSHGNAVDLGQMLPFYRELSKELQVNVLGYDYSGYGCSTGTPSVSNSVADVHACYQYLLQQKGKRPEDIVAYGQSVGSGPSCDLAAHEPQLKGLVLHSPLMSGMRCLSPNAKWWPTWADVFPNIALMPKIEASTFIMHGDDDEVVPFEHGKALYKAAKNPAPPLWAQGYNHQNLECCRQYLPSLHTFLQSLYGKDYGRL